MPLAANFDDVDTRRIPCTSLAAYFVDVDTSAVP